MVGRQLRQGRQRLGMTQVDLAAATGLSVQQVQRYECAYERLSVAALWKLAGVLGVEVGYFFATLPPAPGATRGPAARLSPPAADEERTWAEPAGWFNLAPWRSEMSPTWSG